MEYIGEHLLPGRIGHFAIILSFITVILAAYFSFYASESHGSKKFIKIGKSLYLLHFISVITAVSILFYLIYNHYFEYAYVWQYSSVSLPAKYIISCFWAGQEGSYLIWILFQGLMGLILFFSLKKWQPQILFVISVSQAFLISLVTGITIGTIHIGTTPFTLLRETISNLNGTIFQNPDYLSLLKDGNGLNPLLENIWMTIHPPVLFLGYATSVVPFAYGVAAIWKKDFTGWIRPALVWTMVSLITLGAGILLGGKWAYESLTFGGFWSWDPVENASLVPWLLLVVSLHLILLYHKRKQALFTTLLFSLLPFVFVIYASFLTRSGILGETSAHSFGDDGKELPLIIFNLLFLIVPIILLILRKREMTNTTPEIILSRDFWLFAGSIVVILSSFQIILTTSLPVFNALFNTQIAPPSDRVAFYNTWQIPYVILIGITITLAQVMVFGKNKPSGIFKTIIPSLIISLVITILYAVTFSPEKATYLLYLFTMMLTLSTSVFVMFRQKSKGKNIQALITHGGFSIFLIGVLIAFSNSRIITDPFDISEPGRSMNNRNNILLEKHVPVQTDSYLIVYDSNYTVRTETYYRVRFEKSGDNERGEEFTLFPSVNRNDKMGDVYNPDTRHFLHKDIYTFIMYANPLPADASEQWTSTGEIELTKGDTAFYGHKWFILKDIEASFNSENPENDTITIHAVIDLFHMTGSSEELQIGYQVYRDLVTHSDALADNNSLKIRFLRVSDKPQTIFIGLFEKEADFIVVKIMDNPWISVMWAGAVIMFAGFIISLVRRFRNKPDRIS